MKEIAALIDTGSYTKEVRRVARAVRLTIGLRRKLTSSVLSSFLDFALVPGSEPHSPLSSFVPKVFDFRCSDMTFREVLGFISCYVVYSSLSLDLLLNDVDLFNWSIG